ncbi:MAG TPA: cytochrome P450 [Chitinophagaceae bacterium]|nr:cytochrome P450 [Chitinophagaceae bacterium]
MSNSASGYNMPVGYSGIRTLLRSYQFLKNPVSFVSRNMDIYGDTYTARLPGHKMILTRDAAFVNYVLKDNHTNYSKSSFTSGRLSEFLGKGMLFLNGENWLKQRRLIQPGFHREKIQTLYQLMIEVMDEYLSNFPSGGAIDVYPLMHQLAFNIVIKSLFDIELSPKTMQLLGANFNVIQNFVIKDINQPFRRAFYPFTRTDRRVLAKAAAIKTAFAGIINERKQSGKTYNDLLDMLLQSHYEDTGEPMTDEQVVDELLVFMFAGHETTANTLSWVLYLLSVNKHVLNELAAHVTDMNVFDSVKSDYLNAVINEAMRLFPAAWLTDRVALQDDNFGSYTYPKGTIIISFFYGVHRNKANWADADVFNPHRFLDESGKLKKVKGFFPFGAGPRLWIGNNFAIAEMCFFLCKFFQSYTLMPAGHAPKLKPLLTLRPDRAVVNIQRVSNQI